MRMPVFLMPIGLWFALLAPAAQEEKTKQERSDELVTELKSMRSEYRSLLGICAGAVPPMVPEGQAVPAVGYVAPDPEACDEAEALKKDYSKKYKDLLKLDRKRVLFDNIPKKIDAN